MIQLRHSHVEVDEDTAASLSSGATTELPYSIEIRPPREEEVPNVLQRFTRGIFDPRTKYFKIGNASSLVSMEIRRPRPDRVVLQVSVPSARLDRQVRNHLPTEVPSVEFRDGVNGLPVSEGDTLGGGLLTTSRGDWYPLGTDYSGPPVDSLVSTLHEGSMKDSRFVVQILLKPVTGEPVRQWFWRKRGFQQVRYLKKEREGLWGSIDPSRRDRKVAEKVVDKMRSPRFYVAIRVLVIGAEEYTLSRVKEIAAAFDRFAGLEQDFTLVPLKVFRRNRLVDFARVVCDRRFGGWSRKFQASVDEAAALVSLPSIDQSNIAYSQP